MTSSHQFGPIRNAYRPTGRDIDDPLGLSQLIASGVIDVVPGDRPVPITVWRVADDGPNGHKHADGLTGRTAQLLIGLYTRVGDTVVSIGDDPAIAGAAGAGGCTYLPVDAPHRLADLNHITRTVRLLILPWPPDPSTPDMDRVAIVKLFTACRTLLSADGYTIVAVPPATAEHARHIWQLVPAARRAGLGWVEQIVAITTPISGDRLAVPALPTDRAGLRLADDLNVHIDLYVFVIRGGRRG